MCVVRQTFRLAKLANVESTVTMGTNISESCLTLKSELTMKKYVNNINYDVHRAFINCVGCIAASDRRLVTQDLTAQLVHTFVLYVAS